MDNSTANALDSLLEEGDNASDVHRANAALVLRTNHQIKASALQRLKVGYIPFSMIWVHIVTDSVKDRQCEGQLVVRQQGLTARLGFAGIGSCHPL